MLGVLCTRTKPCIGAPISSPHRLTAVSPSSPFGAGEADHQWAQPRRGCCHHKTNACPGGAASIWHVILPSGGCEGEVRRNILLRTAAAARLREEGSWNAAWDVRPARWLHGLDSAWLLFGVCTCSAPLDSCPANDVEEDSDGSCTTERRTRSSAEDYRVTGVLADGRCLFRAVVHGVCLRNGAEAPDETRQRELADDLRAQVADELLKRREEIAWFIEGDFDSYVKSIRQPYTWGGEPELQMASHILQTQISVFMMDRRSGSLVKIACYGHEYEKDKSEPINVLFHGYGHYDLLEIFSN